MKIKFPDNNNISYDLFQSFLEVLDKTLRNRGIEQQFNHNREHEGDE